MPISVSPDIAKLFHFKDVLSKIKSLKPFIQKLIVDSCHVCYVHKFYFNFFYTDMCIDIISFVECCWTGNLRILHSPLSTENTAGLPDFMNN